MYAPRGFGLSEVGDVEVFPAGDQFHLFHLTLPNHDIVQHAVSDDGLAWRALPHALHTGDPGACDDDQIWTMSVTERDGTYYMLYTALGRAEDGQVQRTALATSPDLIHWTKHPENPVGQADPRWYEADLSASGRVSWRDPKPIRVGDTYYAAVCARERGGPLMRRGCVGLLASSDLVSWEPRPPLFTPHKYWDLECPQVFEIDGHYYLTAAVMEDRTQRYWMAPRFEGPYEVPPDGGVLAPTGHYAGRVCRWQGLDLYYCWHKAEYDWPGFRNPFGKLVVAPLVLFRRPDGSLGRRSFPGWSKYRQADLTSPVLLTRSLYRSAEASAGDAWCSSTLEAEKLPRPRPAPEEGMVGGHPQTPAQNGHWRVTVEGGLDVAATANEASDFWLEGRVALNARIGGLAVRLDDDGGGYFVELTTGSAEVSLRKWLPTQSSDGRPWFRYAEPQRGHVTRSVAPNESLPFHLIVAESYLECSLGGEVVLATLSAERTIGRVGIWAESGTISTADVGMAPLRLPQHT